MSEKTIRYAIVGTGYFGAELGRILSRLSNSQVVAVYDPNNAEKIAKELHCDVETNLDELFKRKDVDAVIVASPNYLHKEPVMKAAEHGVHVFCEKPIALNFKDCDAMVKTCDENNVVFMAGHVMNFFRGVRHAKQLINDGVIGEVLYTHTARNGWEEAQESVSWKKMREKSGGHLYHHIHELDCVQFIMGAPERVTMVGGNVAHQGEQFGDEDDMLLITLEFPNNRFAYLEYGSAFRWPEHYVLIQGTKGAIKLDLHDVKMVVKTEDGEEQYLVHNSLEEDEQRTMIYNNTQMDGAIQYGKPGKVPPLWLQGVMQAEMEFFHGLLLGEVEATEEFKPLLTGEAARLAIATADALTLSLEEDRKVSLTEVYEGVK